MEGQVLFFTGFPGFLGTQILKKLLSSGEAKKVYALVEPRMLGRAKRILDSLPSPEQVEIVEGDICLPCMGIDKEKKGKIAEETTAAFHLAAIYDLAVKYPHAYRVNVQGTENVLNFLQDFPNLKKFIYFSTAYVAGWRRGVVYEEELIDAGFKNHYERTKFMAEKLVRERMDKIPTVIIRPAIVVGDSRTGEISKFDGPYYMMNFFAVFPRWFRLPYVGRGRAEVNLVPVDFIVEATTELFRQDDALGRTFHLADPAPMIAREIYREIHLRMKGKEPLGTVPAFLVRAALYIPPGRKFFKVIPQVIPYLYHQQHFDTSNAEKFLFSKGIKPPKLTDYLDKLIEFFLEHRNEKERFVI